jgi:hypothetical protein
MELHMNTRWELLGISLEIPNLRVGISLEIPNLRFGLLVWFDPKLNWVMWLTAIRLVLFRRSEPPLVYRYDRRGKRSQIEQ